MDYGETIKTKHGWWWWWWFVVGVSYWLLAPSPTRGGAVNAENGEQVRTGIGVFVADWTTVRYVDTATDTVSLIAGSGTNTFADGIGAVASFYMMSDLLCSVSDTENYRTRSIDLKTYAVTTIAGDGPGFQELLRCGVFNKQTAPIRV